MEAMATTITFVALLLGTVVLLVGGVMLCGLLVYFASDFMGNRVWRKLRAAYKLYVIQYWLQKLEREGRCFPGPDDEER